ncbi:P-loop containing nucleoside triphosphate hydrolase protein [Chytriomyces sp. MP71]|nr:P-loop containing nucleoside triphosphate hydrolase protein [Chytriomyces sp. MP71]
MPSLPEVSEGPELSNLSMPEYSSSVLSRWTYSWLNPLLKVGKAHPLRQGDLWQLSDGFTAEHLGADFDAAWAQERMRKDGEKSSYEIRLLRTILAIQYFYSAFYMFLKQTLQISSSIIMLYLIQWIQTPMDQRQHGIWFGYVLGVALFVSQLGATASFNKHLELTSKMGFRLRTSLISAIYKKSFVISNEAKKSFSGGKIVNLTATDTNRIDTSCQNNHYIWAGPYQFVFALSLLVWILGPAGLVGAAVIVAYVPFQYQIVGVLSGFRRQANKFMDKRVKLIQEVLLGIRVVKMYAWEESFKRVISEARSEELKHIRGFLFARSVVNGISESVPILAMLCSFVTYRLLGNELTASKVFAALQLFYTIRDPFKFLPNIVTQGVDAWFGLARVGEFLLASELANQALHLPVSDNENDPAVEVVDGHFAWQSHSETVEDGSDSKAADTFQLKNVLLRIPRGKLVAIVGKVGSGKSSLLSALVGEMSHVSGSVTFRGSVGYCQQSAWIQNTSVKENILFGLKLDSERYAAAVRVSSLERDFEILPNGDETEIGERGINLSGGQKQRVQIARAVYFNPDIVLLDDPLSAVDAHVGRALFEDCILGKLAGKTRILVTHQLQYLSQVDTIVWMDGGFIVGNGSFEELMKANAEFAKLMQEFGGNQDEKCREVNGTVLASVEPSLPETTKAAATENTKKGILVSEERNEGAVKFQVYQRYLFYCGGACAGISIFVVVLFSQSSRVMADEWLNYWTTLLFPLTPSQYIGIYVGLCLILTVFSVTYGVTISYFGTVACWNMHSKALGSVLESPVSFFDATPLGRLTSRFSRDFDSIDNQLPIFIYQCGYTSATALANFTVISIAIPVFLIPLMMMLFVYYSYQVYYRKTALELKRLDSISRSPLLANVSESINGLATIRAYGATDRFIQKNHRLLNNNNRAYYPALLIQRWIQIRVEALNAFLLLSTSIFVIVFVSHLSSGLAGLILVYISQSCAMLSSLVSMSANLEINMNSAERVMYYIDDLEKEKEAPTYLVAGKESLDAEWPAYGHVEVKDVILKYRDDLPPVLQGVTFSVAPGSKIGIIGRTGAGKSTILTCMLRLFPYESGSILIDGVDIKTLPLSELRHRVGVIPQEPVLFSGTIRTNLDPFGTYTDADLWNAIERAGLKAALANSNGGLEAIVTENGENWSTGQRQLICLARAILKDAKVILIDEATASVDLATDDFIQKAIRTNFSSATIMTIAHRLSTIADYDKILVMDAGKVVEFGSPIDLLRDDASHFSMMVAETGPGNAAVIKEVANKRG